MKKSIGLIVLLLLSYSNFAQGVYDNFIYNGQQVKERNVISWPYLREADVMYAKRVVRIIDVREKHNQPMAWAKSPLSLVLYNAVKDGKLTPYQTDSLNTQMSIEKFLTLGTDTEYVDVPIDPNDPTFTQTDTIINPMIPELRIVKYKLIEDWIFDKKHSQMYVRIMAISPRYQVRLGGVDLGEQDLCFFKYHSSDGVDLRHFLIHNDIFNRQNDAARITYDDWFEQRMFNSYIIKESNAQDMYIRDYAEFKDNGVASILEGERIKQELFEKEHDLWEY